eukprot:CAMPEP_0119261632 /NCGR_PEP_ID=MMETSP1329-20130426/1631_1 /TAXON_ID=114041 /ORGANISM="Genus nov. species nov., Strain RCC1024" /LENGTH=515 /DNA_ID=CAMNT_0007261207 /DNA_START=18 /DNA_END=1565 /DNA_ORIENTATION=-
MASSHRTLGRGEDEAHNAAEAEMHRLLHVQKAAFIKNGPPSVEERIRRLDVAINLLVDNADAIAEAIDADFGGAPLGGRPRKFTKFADVAAVVDGLKFARKHCGAWAAPERRSVEFPLGLVGASNWVERIPKGVVGVISPWNYPTSLLFNPLAGIFSAGNSALIKPSEFTPKTSALVGTLLNGAYDETVCRVVTGGPSVGAAFAALPFDHLIFTGSTRVGKMVAKAAAEHLTPCTLELGGKCPVIVSRSADVDVSARRIANGKIMNAGQTCIAPDYVFVPKELKDAFVKAFRNAMSEMYPEGVLSSDDYTGIISDAHFERIKGLIADAEKAGCETLVCAGGNGDKIFASNGKPRRIAPTLVFEPGADLAISDEEIFGPALLVRTYDAVEEALAFVNARPRPLALYYFGVDAGEEAKVLGSTTAGGVCVNDCIMHCAQEDLPFGGIGASGYGAYHGEDGFREFSHARGIHRQVPTSRQYLLHGIYPPYDKSGSTLDMILGMKLTKASDSKLPCAIM